VRGGAVDGEQDEQADRLDVAEALRQRCPRGGPDKQQAEKHERHPHPASRGYAERDRSGGGGEPGAGRFVQ
jgi:hypothetical protein